MGAGVSSADSNDELVDNLIRSGYIQTKRVEQVFRAVDRADYVLTLFRENAYKDTAWQYGNIHLSAPCIYSEVMEILSLEPGMSFLNLGSGTGYFSTMAGLILNQHGTNHGIELHEDCVKYAYERLDEFKQKALALDEFDFCEPLFIQGNCLNITLGRQYDRVYCGAACPESHVGYIKQFVRIGGILVMPFKEHLFRVRRIDEDTWMHFTMLPVSFALLVVPTASEQTFLHLPECDPLSLQELCRGKIRHRLRENVWSEHKDLETKKSLWPRLQINPLVEETLRQFVIPVTRVYDESVSDEDEEFTRGVSIVLSVDTQPGEPYITPQVRVVLGVNENENQNWQELSNNHDSNHYKQDTEHSQDRRASTTQESSLNAEGSSNAESNLNLGEKGSRNRIRTSAFNINETNGAYLIGSDSDSETEQEETFVPCKKVAKREKTDSGIVEDVNLGNEDGSSSSNTNQSDSEIVDPLDTVDDMDVDLSDITLSSTYESQSAARDINASKKLTTAHYVDSNAFSTYMKEKIHQLPLPLSLKLYINYNRQL